MAVRTLVPRVDPLRKLVGNSTAMQALRVLLRRIAATDTTVMLFGESGTGKELVAQALHELSARHRSRFVPVNCGAIPPELLESELFGHRKGAYTGAIEDRKGRFELAHTGTLFLDEIGDMRLEMQVKLLRVLQERAIDRIGEDEPRAVDVRIIAATHRNLEEAVAEGNFREDLFYRLNVFPLHVPALRDRSADIVPLFEHFALRCRLPGAHPIEADEDLQQWMVQQPWQGNCRELLNFVERLSVLWPGTVVSLAQIPSSMLPRAPGSNRAQSEAERDAVLHLLDFDEASNDGSRDPSAPLGRKDSRQFALFTESAPQLASATEGMSLNSPLVQAGEEMQETDRGVVLPDSGVDLRRALAEYESAWLREAMKRCAGNITHAADLLGMRRTTFLERLRKYELSDFRG